MKTGNKVGGGSRIERQKEMKRLGLPWLVYFVVIFVLVFLPSIHPYNKINPTILGLPWSLFWWIVLTVLMAGGMVVFELTTWWRWRGEE